MTAEHDRATPANWPNNNIFGSDVIVPTAETLKVAIENSNKYQNKGYY